MEDYNIYLEPKLGPRLFWLEFRPCFRGLDLQEGPTLEDPKRSPARAPSWSIQIEWHGAPINAGKWVGSWGDFTLSSGVKTPGPMYNMGFWGPPCKISKHILGLRQINYSDETAGWSLSKMVQSGGLGSGNSRKALCKEPDRKSVV